MAQSTGFDTSRLDTTADVCQDFFQYANGSWLKQTQMPPAYSRWGTFNILRDSNQSALRDILENAAKAKASKGSNTELIGNYYAACMDEIAVERAGATPIKPLLNEIDTPWAATVTGGTATIG